MAYVKSGLREQLGKYYEDALQKHPYSRPHDERLGT